MDIFICIITARKTNPIHLCHFCSDVWNSSVIVLPLFVVGRSYEVYSQKMVNAALESLVQKAHCGVVINFEKIGPDPQPIVDGKQ